MNKPEVKRNALIAAANELNTLLDADPKIKTVAVKTEKLIDDIKAAAALVEKGDTITEATNDVFIILGIEMPAGVKIDETGNEGGEDAQPIEPEETEDELGEGSDEGAPETPYPGTEEKEIFQLTVENLVALAGEMNDVMNLAPPIEVIEDDAFDDIKAVILENCYDGKECQVYATDKFSDAAWMTLKEIGVIPVDEDGKPVEVKKEEKPVKESKESKEPKKKAEKPSKTEKKEKAEKKTAEKAEKPASTPKKEKSAKYTRVMAICETIKSECIAGCTINDLLKLSDENYAKKVENATPSHSNAHRYIADALVLFGIVKIVDGKFKLA